MRNRVACSFFVRADSSAEPHSRNLFAGKAIGLPMGRDICYAVDWEADRDDMDTRLTIPGVAGAAFIHG